MRSSEAFDVVYWRRWSARWSTSAFAQDKAGYFILGGGYTAPNGEVRDHLGDGYNFVIGGQYNATPVIGIEGLYSFNGLGEKRISIPVSPIARRRRRSHGLLRQHEHAVRHGERRVSEAGRRRSDRTASSAWASTTARSKVTTPGVGYMPGYCDPFWYVCYPGGFVPVDNIVGERSSTDFGMDFGGGVKFGAFYADARYHYIWGPEIEEQQRDAAGRTPISGPSGRRTVNFSSSHSDSFLTLDRRRDSFTKGSIPCR